MRKVVGWILMACGILSLPVFCRNYLLHMMGMS